MRRLSETPAVVLGIAVASIAPFVAVVSTGRTLLWFDTARLYDPIRSFVVEALRSGRLPLWNPHEALGQPVFGQLMHGVLHPVSLVLAAVAPGSGAEGLVIAYVGLGGAGAALLLRLLGASAAAAAASGLTYAWSGYVLGMSSNLVFLAAGATAPWTVAALRRATVRDGWALALGAIGVAVQHLAGDPQWTIAAVAIGALLAFDAQGWPGLRRAGGAVALGTALAAVQLVPGWYALADSHRAVGLSPQDRVQWALSPWRIVELALPGFYGTPSYDVSVFRWLGGPTSAVQKMAFAPSIAVGATALLLAGVAATASRTGKVLALASAGFLWLALGYRAGAQQLLAQVPVWGLFRYSEKLVGPLTLCLVVLAGIGLDGVGRGALRERWRWVAGSGLGALVAALALVAARGSLAAFFPGVPAWPVALAHVARGLAYAGSSLLAVGVLLAPGGRPGWDRWRAPAIATVCGAAALAAAPFAVHVSRSGLVDLGWLARLRSADGPVRLASAGTDDAHYVPDGIVPLDGVIAAQARHGMPPLTTPIRVDAVSSYSGLSQRRWSAFEDYNEHPILRWRAWRRLGLTHVVLNPPTTEPQALSAMVAKQQGRQVGELPDWQLSAWEVPHRSWASFARSVKLAKGMNEALMKLAESLLAATDEVALEAPAAPPLGPGRVLSWIRGANEVRLDVEATSAGLLVVADSYAPGWVAEVDGKAAPIWPADVLARAVPVPAGRHVVVMRYECPGLLGGEIVSGLALAGTVALVVWSRRRAQAQAAAEPAPGQRARKVKRAAGA